jgi:hypothetical protein
MSEHVVVYRSMIEQQADEFWSSEGYLTATKCGDAIIAGIMLCIALFIFAKGYEAYTRFMNKRRRNKRELDMFKNLTCSKGRTHEQPHS